MAMDECPMKQLPRVSVIFVIIIRSNLCRPVARLDWMVEAQESPPGVS